MLSLGKMASSSYYAQRGASKEPTVRPLLPGGGGQGQGGGGVPGGSGSGGNAPGVDQGIVPGRGGGTDAEPGGGSVPGGGGDEYYSADPTEPEGVWYNPAGLFGLEDGGPVDNVSWHRLYHGFSPGEGKPLTKLSGKPQRCPGLDWTFSADKSISALWAIADPELKAAIEKAHYDAIRSVLEDVLTRHCSWTRLRQGGRGAIRVVEADIMAALWQHGSSREGDPDLHTHCCIFNLARTHEDNKWRAHHAKPLYRWKKAAGAMYRAELAHLLRERLGVRIEKHGRDGEFTRIEGLPDELLREWSKRRAQIVAAAAKMGYPVEGNASRAAAANLATRASKEALEDAGDVREVRWALEAAAHGKDLEQMVGEVVGHDVPVTPEEVREVTEALGQVPDEAVRNEAVFRLPNVVEAVCNASAGTLGREARGTAVERVLRNPKVIRLDRPGASPDVAAGLAHTAVYTTEHTVELELKIRDMAAGLAERNAFGLDPKAVERRIGKLVADGYKLDGEQTAAIRAATSRGAVAVIEGAAGSGKTTTLRPIVDLYRDAGHTVHGAAVAWRTAQALGTDCGIQPFSIHRLLKRARKGELKIDDRTVIVVDEAGMMSERQMHHVLQLGTEYGAKVILTGDTQQQQAIEAGPGLRLVRDVVEGVRVDTIRRQKADAEDILMHRDGLAPEGARLAAEMLPEAERERLAAEFAALPDGEREGLVPWQVTASEAFRDCRAAEAVAAYAVRGRFHVCTDLDRTLAKLVGDWAAFTEAHPDKSALVLARTNAEVEALGHLMRERVLARRGGDTERAVVHVSRGRESGRDTSPLEIARGDRLRIGATNWGQRLFNGSIVTVDDFETERAADGGTRVLIRGRTDDGRRVAFWHDSITDWYGNIRLDYGYALTIASAQGSTVDRAFLLADDKPARETIYPAATRHRERLDIYVDRQPVALEIAQWRPEDADGKAVTDAEVTEWLARAWSREQPKAAALDFMSEGMSERMRERHGGPAGGRRADPEDRDAASWLAANDNGGGRLRTAASALRRNRLEMRHGGAVAKVAKAATEVIGTLAAYGDRAAAEGNAVALEPGYDAALRRAEDVLQAAQPYRTAHYRPVTRAHGIGPRELEGFEGRVAQAERRRNLARHEARAAAGGGGTMADAGSNVADLGRERARRQWGGGARDIRDALAGQAEAVCRHYLPEGRRNGAYWQVGDVDGSPGNSLYVRLSGDRRGRWADAATGQRGDLLDLIRANRGLASIGDAMREGRAWLGGGAAPTAAPARPPGETADDDGRRRQGLEKWLSRAFPVSENSAAGRYLRKRGLDPSDAAGLRFHPRAMVRVDDHVSQAPALLAPVRDREGRLEAVHRIYMTPEGDAPDIGGHKRTSGGPREGAVTLGARKPARAVLTEGVEDALAVWQALDHEERADTAVMASISAGRIASVAVPDTVREIVLVQDRDQAGERAWADLQRRWEGSGIEVRRILPIGKDANEDLLEHGRDGLRDVLEPLTARAVPARMLPAGDGDVGAPGAADIAWQAARGTPAEGELLDRMRREVLRLCGPDVRVRFREALEGGALGEYLDGVIHLAIGPGSMPFGALNHEAMEALIALGAITPQEWEVLQEKARADWMAFADRYSDEPEHVRVREAVCEAYRLWSADRLEVPRGIGHVLDRIGAFLGQVRSTVVSFLRNRGLLAAEGQADGLRRDAAVEAIFRSIRRGERWPGAAGRRDVGIPRLARAAAQPIKLGRRAWVGSENFTVGEVPASRQPSINIHGTAGKAVARARTEGVLVSGSPPKTYWNHDLEMPIAVARVGISKTWHENRLDPGARELLAALPEILENAVLTNSEEDRRRRNKFIRAYHMRAAVILNNKLRRVELVLRHTREGVHFYLLKETPPTGLMRRLTVANGNVSQNQKGAPHVGFGSHRVTTSGARRSPSSSRGALLHISVLLDSVKPPADGRLVLRSRTAPTSQAMLPFTRPGPAWTEADASPSMVREEEVRNDFRELQVQWERLEKTAEGAGVPMDDLPDYPDHEERLREFAFRDDLTLDMREWADGAMDKATSLDMDREGELGDDFRELQVQWERLEKTAEGAGVPMDDLPDYPDHEERLREFAFRDDLTLDMREWADGAMDKATSLDMDREGELGDDFRELQVQWERLEKAAEGAGVPMDDLPDYPDHEERLREFAFRDDLTPDMREWADGAMDKATSLDMAKAEPRGAVAPGPAEADAGPAPEPKAGRPASSLGRLPEPPAEPAAHVPVAETVPAQRKTRERKVAAPAEDEHKPTVRRRTRRRGRSM